MGRPPQIKTLENKSNPSSLIIVNLVGSFIMQDQSNSPIVNGNHDLTRSHYLLLNRAKGLIKNNEFINCIFCRCELLPCDEISKLSVYVFL